MTGSEVVVDGVGGRRRRGERSSWTGSAHAAPGVAAGRVVGAAPAGVAERVGAAHPAGAAADRHGAAHRLRGTAGLTDEGPAHRIHALALPRHRAEPATAPLPAHVAVEEGVARRRRRADARAVDRSVEVALTPASAEGAAVARLLIANPAAPRVGGVDHVGGRSGRRAVAGRHHREEAQRSSSEDRATLHSSVNRTFHIRRRKGRVVAMGWVRARDRAYRRAHRTTGRTPGRST